MPKPNLAALGIKPKGRSISKVDFNSMKKIFIDFDKDNSGTVTYQEFLKSLGEKKELQKQAGSIFSQMDKDGNGEMSFPELLQAFYPQATEEDIARTIEKYTPKVVVAEKPEVVLTEEQREDIEAMYKMWDKDGDCKVSKTELRDACQNLGIEEETINEWFATYDSDGNEELELEEVMGLLKEFFPA